MELPHHQRLLEEAKERLAIAHEKEFKRIKFIVNIPELDTLNHIEMSLPIDKLKEQDTIVLDVVLTEHGRNLLHGRKNKGAKAEGRWNDDGSRILELPQGSSES
jgi:hypothetical protein